MVSARHVVESTRAGDGYGVFMSFADTLISPAFECLTSSPVPEPFPVNITYKAQIDLQRYPDYRDICLGHIRSSVSSSGQKFNYWQCVLQSPADRMAQPVISVSELKVGQVSLESQRTSPIGIATATFGKCGTGTIYGFIHSPIHVMSAGTVESSNWVNQYLVYIFIGLAVIVAILIFSIYACRRLFRYRNKYHETRTAVDEQMQEVFEMQQFGGRHGKKDQDVTLTENPLVAQLADLEHTVSDKAMEQQQANLREAQADAVIREEQRREIARDKARLEMELEKMKAALKAEQVIAHANGGSAPPLSYEGETTEKSGFDETANIGPPLTMNTNKAFDQTWAQQNQKEFEKMDVAKMRKNRRKPKNTDEEGDGFAEDDD